MSKLGILCCIFVFGVAVTAADLLGPVKASPSLPAIWKTQNGQERANYLKAARLDACRNLCERLYGLRLLLQQKPLSSNTITSNILVLTRGVKEVGKPVYFADGRIQITIKLDGAVWRDLLKSSPDTKFSTPLLKSENPGLYSAGFSAIADSTGEKKLQAARAARLQAMSNLCNLIKVMAQAGDKQAKEFLNKTRTGTGITMSVPDIVKSQFIKDDTCKLKMTLPLPGDINKKRKLTVSGVGRAK